MGQNPQLHIAKDDQTGRKAGECGLQRKNRLFIWMDLTDVSANSGAEDALCPKAEV